MIIVRMIKRMINGTINAKINGQNGQIPLKILIEFVFFAICLVFIQHFGATVTGAGSCPNCHVNSDGETIATHHEGCSNEVDVCIRGCTHDHKERAPKQNPPTTTTTPAPQFGQTTTTTPSEIRCSTTNDCKINFVCCQNVCKDQSIGICRDVNGDGIPDWLVYIV
jgi:hypothetical protein